MIADIGVAATTAAPVHPHFDCQAVENLPYKGAEVLAISCVFIFLAVVYQVGYLDLILKQIFPSLIDPNVLRRVALIQQIFPNVALTPEEKELLYTKEGDEKGIKSHYAPVEEGATAAPVEYDQVVAQSSYVSSKTIDDDLTIGLANVQSYETVSDYCSSSTRGYSQLAVLLPTCAFCLCFLWMHNMLLDPQVRDVKFWPYLSLIGYCLCILTSLVMDQQPQISVLRRTNIALWFSIPYNLNGKGNPAEKLHTFGIVMFSLLPTISHLLQALTLGKEKLLDYELQMTIIILTFVFAAVFGTAKKIADALHLARMAGAKIEILFELLTIFTAIIGFAYWEGAAAMFCSGNYATWQKVLLAAFFGPWLLVAKSQFWAPTEFPLPPSLLLLRNNKPVATFGPCSAVDFHSQIPTPTGGAGHTTINKGNGVLPRINAGEWKQE